MRVPAYPIKMTGSWGYTVSSMLSRFSITVQQRDIPLMMVPVYQNDRKLGAFRDLFAERV